MSERARKVLNGGLTGPERITEREVRQGLQRTAVPGLADRPHLTGEVVVEGGPPGLPPKASGPLDIGGGGGITGGMGKKAPLPVPPPWREGFPKVEVLLGDKDSLARLKAVPGYEAAKAPAALLKRVNPSTGVAFTPEEAERLSRAAANLAAEQIVTPGHASGLAARHPNAHIAAIHAEEMQGRNKLPTEIARRLSVLGGLPIDRGIIQVNKTGHTGATAMERFVRVPLFGGPVVPGREYLLVDDVLTTGSSFAAERHYIESLGGVVVGCVSAASASAPRGLGGVLRDSAVLAPTIGTLEEVRRIYGEKTKNGVDMSRLDRLLSSHGYSPSHLHLTESQATFLCYLGGFEHLAAEIRRAVGGTK